jgi:hypothetical protein
MLPCLSCGAALTAVHALFSSAAREVSSGQKSAARADHAAAAMAAYS